MRTVTPIQPARIPVTVLTGFLGAGKLTALLARQGFRVQGHILELFGLCARCQAAVGGAR